MLIEALIGTARSRIVRPCLAVFTLVMQAILSGLVFSAEQTWSGLLAALLWSTVLWRLP
ncbi:MAG: hypothetical protein ABI833_14705 [Acidobacteriota bacterium]